MNYKHLQGYYRGKRVFVTGHTGFKGSWLIQWLNLLGAAVKGYALAPQYQENLYDIIEGDQLCQSIIADINDRARVAKEILSFEPDYIFHLAAQPLVRLSYETPVETFATNVVGTANILDAVRSLNKPCSVILITTDKVYHNHEWIYPYRESDRLGGYDPYSASKACAELVISSYRNSFFPVASYSKHQKAIASARAGNVIGGGDWAKDRIIPDIVRALRKSEPVLLRNPRAVRPWQHVLEPLGGYLHLGTKMVDDPQAFSDCWNFGPNTDDNLTVEVIAQIAITAWGSGHYMPTPNNGALHEAGLLSLDISKARSLLNWHPKYAATVAIEKTINWYRTAENYQSGRNFLVKQIQDFMYE